MSDLLAIFGFCLLCFLFLQHRKQAELARRHIQRKCDELHLQVVSVAFARHHFWHHRHWRWRTRYLFEFSALGDDCYQGYLEMSGFRMADIYLPPYRILPEDLDPTPSINERGNLLDR